MVLLCSANTPGTTTVFFDGWSDVREFLFFYDHVLMASKTDEEKALKLFRHLDGAAFNFYYYTFASGGDLV